MPTKTFMNLKPEKQNRILHVAMREFSRTSVEKVSIQSIVEGAGIPRGSFYQYFEDKDDLLLYCFSSIQKKIPFSAFYDYTIHRLYSKDPSQDLTSPWYREYMEQIREILPAEEFNFVDKEIKLPIKFRLAVGMETAENDYPRFLQGLREQYPDVREERLDQFAFFMSVVNILCYEYAQIHGCTSMEAFSHIAPALRLLHEDITARDPAVESSGSVQTVLTALNSHPPVFVHLLSARGIDLSVPVGRKEKWKIEARAGKSSYIGIAICGERIKGTFPYRTEPVSVPDALKAAAETGGRLTIELREDGGHLTPESIFITTSQQTRCFDCEGVVLLAADAQKKRICLMEQGEFTI